MYSNTVSAFERDVPANCSRLQSIKFIRHAHCCYTIHTGTFLPDCTFCVCDVFRRLLSGFSFARHISFTCSAEISVLLITGCVHPHKGFRRGLGLGTSGAYLVLSVWSVLQLHCVIASASCARSSMPDAVCCVCSSCSAAPPAAASSSRHNRSGVLQSPGSSLLLHYRPYRETREHRDDLVQRIIGPISRIQHHLEAAGLFVLRGLRDAGFTVSPKTTLVTTDLLILSLDGCVPSCRLSGIVHCLCGRCWYRSRPCHPPSNSERHKALQGCSPPCQENVPTCQEPHERAHHQNAGHIAAVITTLLDACWNPVTATCREDPDGDEWNAMSSGTLVDLSPILSAVAASLSSSLWKRAAGHWNGISVEQGLDLRSSGLYGNVVKTNGMG